MELYFHIPFCIKKCFYCDFLSAPAEEETKQNYMEALLAETVGSASSCAAYTVATVFIGGGTPSVVPAACIERLMAAVRGHYRLERDAEVTIEVNPGTVSAEELSRFRAAGINRLSIGLQSADNGELAMLGRIHTWEQFTDTFSAARKAGFENVNVDVMSALPGQTLPRYRNTLKKLFSLEQPPEHISAYSLILEEGTPFYDMYERGKRNIPDEEEDRLMYQETKRFLAGKGYRRYEISNYARAGFECRHNSGYWRRENYVGFGIGASSLVDNTRFQNSADLKAYLENPLGCRMETRHLSREEQMEEFMFLGLRMTAGISCAEFRRLFGCDIAEVYGDVIEKNIRDGLLAMSFGQGEGAQEEDKPAGSACLALTDRGLDVSNYVMAQFLL